MAIAAQVPNCCWSNPSQCPKTGKINKAIAFNTKIVANATDISVVGAGAAYGEEALKVATTIKLTRALWIIPLALATSFIFKGSGKKISVPWFIFYFIGAIILNTYVLDGIPQLGQAISDLARKGLIITMFFIGASLSMDVLKQVGMKPLIQGVILWVVISLSTLAYILLF